MKVVHVLHQYPPEFRGGTEVCVETLAAAQQARGDDVLVVAGSDERHDQGLLREEQVEGVPVCRVLRRPGENYSVDHRLPRVAEQVVERIDAAAPDVVHLHHTLNLSGDLAARLTRAGHAVVATLHDFTAVCARFFLARPDGSSCAEAWPLPAERCVACVLPDFPAGQQALEQELVSRTRTAREEAEALRLAVVPSEVVRRRWLASGLWDAGRLVTVPHASALAGSTPGGAPRPREADGRLILATWGHLAPAKGLLDLLAALALADDPRLALLVLGEPVDAEFAAALLEASEGLPVTFAGRYGPEELRGLASQADLAVFPSRAEETFGLVVAEARALGLPVLASDRGALPEGVGEAGRTVPAADPGALAGALLEIAGQPELLARWRGAAATAPWTPSSHAARLSELYESALASP